MKSLELEQLQIASNETILKLIDALNKKFAKMEKVAIAAMIIMLLQTMTIVGGVLYFFSAYAVEVEDTVQMIEGDNTSINNIEGNDNTITNTHGGIE